MNDKAIAAELTRIRLKLSMLEKEHKIFEKSLMAIRCKVAHFCLNMCPSRAQCLMEEKALCQNRELKPDM